MNTMTNISNSLQSTQRRQGLMTWFLTVVMLLAAMPTLAADWMHRSDFYTLTKSDDHVSFSMIMADLDNNNTFAGDWGGIIATCGNTSVEVLIVYGKDDKGDEASEYSIYALNRNNPNYGGKVYITNIHPTGEKEVAFGSGEDVSYYTIKKSDHYPKIKIDFYWPASMNGKTWSFKYCYNHIRNNGSDDGWQEKSLGSAYLDAPNYGTTKLEDFSYTRPQAEKIKFSVPALVDNTPSKVKDIRWKEGHYDLKFNYVMPSGKTIVSQKTIDLNGSTQNVDVDIPADALKFKQLNLSVIAHEYLKNKGGGEYSHTSSSWTKNNIFPNGPQPNSLKAEFKQFDKKAILTWNNFEVNSNYIADSKPYVYRVETDETGNILSGRSWSKRGTAAKVEKNNSGTFTDQGVEQSTYYKYMVVSVPTAWENKGNVNNTSLNNPTKELLNTVGYVESGNMDTKPVMSIFDIKQDTTATDKVKITWQYSRVPTTAQKTTFQVMRKITADGEWQDFAKVNGDSNPASGTELSFIDDDLPDPNARYQYKVVVELNNGKDRFESDAITAGFIKGTIAKEINATKGVHEKAVRVTWKAKQVGTAGTTYSLYRRYAGTNDDFLKIHSETGTAEQYTYEDNTVLPGRYYEYRVEVYDGTEDSGYKHTLSDVGFCQARGVLSGMVSFGTGTAVEDVRVRLRPSDDNDDNSADNYSKYIGGASTGIAWYADETETNKLFGDGKNYTMQMFVRPENNLAEGAVIGSIPYEGDLMFGSKTDDGYPLMLGIRKPDAYGTDAKDYDNIAWNMVDISTLTGDYTAQNHDMLTGTLQGKYKISVANGATVAIKDVDISDEDIMGWVRFAGLTLEGNGTICLFGENKVMGGYYGNNPGIFVPKDYTLTIVGDGKLDVSTYGYSSAIGGKSGNDCGNIVIKGGTINAKAYSNGAAIGSSAKGRCGDITIYGGNITAVGDDGAGIGSGWNDYSSCGNITIYGGNITAVGDYGAGIGSGATHSSCGNITIYGGEITATGEKGSGIGSGATSSSCGNITIYDGVITATGDDGAGIGSAFLSTCGEISIEGGTIVAIGENESAGIGGSYNSTVAKITIAKTVNSVTATKGNSYSGNAIGGCRNAPTIVIEGDMGDLTLNPYEYQGMGKPANYIGVVDLNQTIPADIYSLLSFTRNGSNATIQVNDSIVTINDLKRESSMNAFSVGGTRGITADNAFIGNVTEVRVFDHVLTDKERASYADRILNGREQGLKLYWPMDEGLDRFAFDASYSNDMPNGRHATVGANVENSVIIPNDAQLSRYALTNGNGEYIIRGIPFTGTGSTYTVTPTKGIHTFTPQARTGFIGSDNLTLNNYDFTDNSSFPVKGVVRYLNTNIPVDSVQFTIDGSLAQNRDGVLMTDAKGEFEISVPIGSHRIQAVKQGHRLTGFPRNGTTHDFYQAETVNFVDSTLVNVTGRINGGFTDKDEPLGFGRSVNRLGQATIKLSLGKDADCSFNYIPDEHGDEDFGTEPIPVESATENIESTAYRAGGNHDETYFIYITTDRKTGEFSAMLPPLKYKVESINFVNGKDYDNKDVFAQNLPVIDATNAMDERMMKDSLEVNGVMQWYKYSGKLMRQWRNAPTIDVYQTGMRNGAFGEEKVEVAMLDNSTDSVAVVNFTDDGYSYVYDHPIFKQNGYYEFNIDLSEKYLNLDTKEIFNEVPTDAVVTITNDASATTVVYADKAMVDGKEMQPGEEFKSTVVSITPDSLGHVTYQWVGGWPNLASGNLRRLNISANVDGRTTMWKAPDSETEALDLLLFGGITTGTNFVTEAPGADQVDMILRRPPGNTSSASYTSETVHTYGSTNAITTSDHGVGGGLYVSLTPTIDWSWGTDIMGITLASNSKLKVIIKTRQVIDRKWSEWDVDRTTDTYTVTEKMTTPSKMAFNLSTKDYRAEGGDTYIGRSTNLQFGKGKRLGIFQEVDGTYKIDTKDAITIGESFGTTFVYPQQYIEDYLIPNWQAMIDAKLQHVDGNHWDENVAKRVPGKVMYYTKYKPGDKDYAVSNGDRRWSLDELKATDNSPSYKMVNGTGEDAVDSVAYFINQISMWKQTMAHNEEDKLNAFNNSDYLDRNYSISGGTSVSQTSKTSHTHTDTFKKEYTFAYNSETNIGALLNEAGAYAIIKGYEGYKHNEDRDTTVTTSSTVAWTMSDADPRTALSVDVYDSPNGWGPIFRTRGGQTVDPYEGATYTKYYQEGTKLNEATMRVELPELYVEGSTELTNVPTGGEARFILKMRNASETGSICTYKLEALENSNAKGAIMMIDGAPLSIGTDGRHIKMKGGEEVLKTLVVSQSDRSVTDFENIVLQLKSINDVSTESEKVYLRVHFVPASAHVDLKVAHTVLTQKEKLKATLCNIDTQDEGLKGVRLQYRRKGYDSWTLGKQWALKQYMEYGDEELKGDLECEIEFLEDGDYEVRGQSFGKYGNEDVTYETPIINVTQDTRGPKILGMPSPESGLLTYNIRNNMHVRFNETLNGNALSKTDNFRIYGDLNNVAQKSQYPDVALQLNGDEVQTEAMYDISENDFALDLWLYRQADGTIISMGTEDNKLALYTHDDGKLAARVGGEEDTYETPTVLPKNKWTYMALSYKRRDANDAHNRLSMLYVTADMNQPTYVGNNLPAKDFHAIGQLAVGGNGMVGKVHDLTLWNIDKTVDELYETRDQLKAAYTPGLIGYWRMNEGHGTTVSDKARSRHIVMPAESWYINNRNIAAHLDGTEPLKVDISTFNPRKTDNFAVEMWFRAESNDGNNKATLMAVPGVMGIGFANGLLSMEMGENKFVISDANYIDNAWHHLTLNTRRGTSAIVYVDGQAVKTLPESQIPAVSGHYLYVGGDDADDNLIGDVDEIRIWNAALASDVIANRRYERLNNGYTGLLGYFPMEDIHRDESGNIVSEFSVENKGVTDSQLKIVGNLVEASTSPALLPGSQHMRLADSDFGFTASADEIYFNFDEDKLALMDGNDFTVTVENIKDEHGNSSEPVEWMFTADFATVRWLLDKDAVIDKKWDETVTFTAYLVGESDKLMTYEISGLPSWMSIDKTIGVAGALQEITFTVGPTAPIGRHTEYIYVTDHLGMRRVLKVQVVVRGNEPDWKVDPSLYESNMTMTGQIYIGDKICENVDSKVALFDEMGMCRGVGQPKYVNTRDAYYVDMIVYGASATELSTGQRDLSVKMYDASSGIVYPSVSVTLPNGNTSSIVKYAPDANYGTYDKPVMFRATGELLQTVSLPVGWTWMSVYVDQESTAINDVLPQSKNEMKKYKNVKGKTAFAAPDKDFTTFLGSLQNIEPGNMYKIQVGSRTTLDINGKPIDVSKRKLTIYPEYNWIGSYSPAVMSLEDAFAELQPKKDDMVKTRTAMATYNGQGVWEGTLKNIVPGEGYIYYSTDNVEKSFRFPHISQSGLQTMQMPRHEISPSLNYYEPEDDHRFPDNMNVIAVITKNGSPVDNAELGGFVNSECRGATTAINGYYFLTVMGSGADDTDEMVRLSVYVDGIEYNVGALPFISDAFYGTLEEPIVFDLDLTGIDNVSTYVMGNITSDVYDLSGRLVYSPKADKRNNGLKQLPRGVYIVNGRKVVIK